MNKQKESKKELCSLGFDKKIIINSTYDPPKPMFTINTQILYLSTNNTQFFFEIHVKNEKKNLSMEWIQVNLCRKRLFLHQLTNNMTAD